MHPWLYMDGWNLGYKVTMYTKYIKVGHEYIYIHIYTYTHIYIICIYIVYTVFITIYILVFIG